jgi:hypothetical protein
MKTPPTVEQDSLRAAPPRRVLFLDDDPRRGQTFLARYPDAVWVETAVACIARLHETWDEVHLDHDLGGEVFVNSDRPDCGMEVVRWLTAEPRALRDHCEFIVHSHNAEAAEAMVAQLQEAGYNVSYRPFGFDLLEWLLDGSPLENLDSPSRGWKEVVNYFRTQFRRILPERQPPSQPSPDAAAPSHSGEPSTRP